MSNLAKETDRREADRLRRILQRYADSLDINFQSWATRAGISPNTIYNFMNRPTAKSLSFGTYKKLADVFPDLTPEQLMGRDSTAMPTSQTTAQIIVRGAVQAGAWRSAWEWEPEEQYRTAVPYSGGRPSQKIFGLEVLGDSMNEVFPERSILACCPIHQYHDPLVSGKRVIVERFRGDEVEATCKELVFSDDAAILQPRSTNPIHQPISFPWPQPSREFEVDDIIIRISAVVVAYAATI